MAGLVKLSRIAGMFEGGLSRSNEALLCRLIRSLGTEALVRFEFTGEDSDHATLTRLLHQLDSGKVSPIYRF